MARADAGYLLIFLRQEQLPLLPDSHPSWVGSPTASVQDLNCVYLVPTTLDIRANRAAADRPVFATYRRYWLWTVGNVSRASLHLYFDSHDRIRIHHQTKRGRDMTQSGYYLRLETGSQKSSAMAPKLAWSFEWRNVR